MKAFKCIVAYDGTSYAGWQRQKDQVTIQSEIEDAMKKLLRTHVPIDGSGRTDAGVHASGQVFSFHYDLPMPLKSFKTALNRLLPADICVLEVEETVSDFHARFSAKGKTYAYHIYRSELRNPFRHRTAWQVYGPLDVERMRMAAAFMEGTHDFSAFMASGSSVKDAVRTIYEITIDTVDHDEEVHMTFSGNGFLYNMVRIMTGLLVEVGKGKKSPESVKTIIDSRIRSNAPLTAPAQGLFLMKVHYSENE